MRKLLSLSLVSFLIFAPLAPALAATPVPSAMQVQVVGSDGVEKGTTGSPNAVQGNVAAGANDSGNPVKVGGKYNASPPTLTDGLRGDIQLGTKGAQNVTLFGQDSVNAVAVTSVGSDAQAAQISLNVRSQPVIFNGSTVDREFTCANSAVVNVTAGATTQVVALVASTQVRVCSVAISMSAAGTAKFVYGTGTNCGTGATDISGAMPLGTTTPMALSAPAGGSLFRTATANALCVTAVTGNVLGFVTYAQF